MSFTTSAGTVVQLWPHRPDGEVLERLEWLTDVLPSFSGAEQRVALREAPRRSFEFSTLFSARAKREAENLLWSWGAKPFAVPVWVDAQPLPAAVDAGDTTIPVTPTTRDYHADGLLALIGGPSSFEVFEIDSVGVGTVTLKAAAAASWPATRTIVVPLRVAELESEQPFARFTGGDSYGRFRWLCQDVSEWAAASEMTTYRDVPVQLGIPNWREDVSQTYVRKLSEFDPLVGARFRDDESGGATALQSHLWTLDGRAAIADFRAWLYALAGRCKHFWVPTWSQDFRVAADIGGASTSIDVEHSRYADLVAQDIGRRDLRIATRSGAVYYRRITGCTSISADVERLTISSALGTDVSAQDVALVSFMQLVRLDADAVEINWLKQDLAECRVMVRGVRNDL